MHPDFDTITQRLETGKLYSFPGGVHPEDRKTLSNRQAIARPPLPPELIIPIRQHIGTQGRLAVEVGQRVKKGEPLTTSAHPFAIPVHAPTSGTVRQISDRTIAHPSGLSEPTVTLEPDGDDKWTELTPLGQYKDLPDTQIIEALCHAGISGMGGAGFPTHIKAANTKAPEFLIINGAECEPYISADDRLMREHAWQVRQGIDVLQHLISPQLVIVALEDNKPEALEAMKIACQDKPQIKIVSVPTKYPAGGEKQLIQAVTGREVPREGLPIDIGVVMFNVGTCYAVADAVFQGKPLIERVVTLTGEALDNPHNVWALIGTPINHLLGYAGYNGSKQTLPQVIMGGPMMGFTLNDAQVPVVKITNCVLVPATGELTQGEDERACIRCGACADACPASLLPQQIFWHAKAREYDKAEEYDLFDCIECGACAYVCPSEIPLVHYYRQAKSEIRVQRDEKAKAEKAKERFEARKARLEREKIEREEKHRKAKEARAAAASGKSDEAPKDKVAAALARAKAKKQQTPTQVSDTSGSDAPESKKQQVSAAIARAKAKKAAQHTQDSETNKVDDSSTPVASEDKTADKKAQVAAAVARAKAKKAAKHSQDSTAEDHDNSQADTGKDQTADKKAQVAAAVARAKAKKAAKHSQDLTAEDHDNSQADTGKDQTADKKAQVAAAVARAKAKKAAKHSQDSTAESHGNNQADADSKAAGMQPEESAEPCVENSEKSVTEPVLKQGPETEKQRRIAAAVARAKAKKALQNGNSASDEVISSSGQDEGTDKTKTTKNAAKDASQNADQQKQQRIAAAVAKAKAKKAQQATIPSPSESDNGDQQSDPVKPASKDDRVAAAVAKAKAKQAARKAASDENKT
ncbi:electron transport complex subunit RsxC [Alteromonas lipotrueiana]|uniref:electron transport complex subunit RsxC n=1 Tax=Alteromonas lipotrueiana TaxID=2803815 RepID=UPI001C46F585|nr:electron transport complex subunit RsxC [Alteromonas lipotrueiana]